MILSHIEHGTNPIKRNPSILQKFKISFWRKLVSYFHEISLESVDSIDGYPLDVVLSNGRIMLVANNAIYSYDDLYVNYTKALLNLRKDLDNNSHILVLGLGMGSIPFIIEKLLKKNCHYTLVEYDEEVIYLASKYGLSRLESSHEIVCADAFAFVMQNDNTYDLICMDVFNDDVVPEAMTTIAYATQLKELLAPDGVLLYNRLYQFERDQEDTDEFEQNVFSKVFPDYSFLEVEGNRVYCSDKRFLTPEK